MSTNFNVGFVLCLLLFAVIDLVGQQESSWHGHRILDFSFEGREAKIVFPDIPADQRYWIWRARFWNHEPQVDLALVEKGFHLVYIDVSDLYGNRKAIEIWDRFYSFMRDSFELHPRAVLEGLSRGGLMVYNWAAENTDKVACIYADAPVCDINSWPGGKGKGIGSFKSWATCLDAHGISEQEAASSFSLMPVHTAKRVAEAQIPVIHVCGSMDSIVPIQENSYQVEKIFHEHNAPFLMIEKEGIGHHPHSLKDPKPVVRFVLEATDSALLDKSLIADAQRTIQFRGDLNNTRLKIESGTATIAFLGGSITHNNGWRNAVGKFFMEKYPNTKFNFINAGIPSMGSTPGAFRLKRDVLEKGPIDLLFVEAAVNDATNGRTRQEMARGMEGIVRHTLQHDPTCDIIMMHFVDPGKMAVYNKGGIPPVIIQHERVASYYQITSINLAKEVNDRILNGEFSWKDDFKDLHPSPFGQEIYAKSVIHTLENLLGSKKRNQIVDHNIPRLKWDKFSYDNGDFLSIKKAKTKRDWKIHRDWRPTDGAGTRKGFVGVDVLESNTPGSIMTLNFTGKAIGILVTAGPDAGVLEFSIDGSYYEKVDLFTKWSQNLHLPWVYVLGSELYDRKHNLVLKVSQQKNEKSTGHAIRVHQFVVN